MGGKGPAEGAGGAGASDLDDDLAALKKRIRV